MSHDSHFHDDSDCELNTFVQKDAMPSKSHHGHEFDQDVANDEQFIAKIFRTESYNHTHQSTVEFYSDVFYVMNNKKVNDRKTVGDILVKKNKGSACGGPFGGSKKHKQRITNEDIYVAKLQAFISLARIQEFTSKYDINNLRLFVEMVLEESIAALNISIFNRQKEIKKYLAELRKIIIGEAYLDAMFLSCRLFKSSFKYQKMDDPENVLNAAKRINGVFIPYVKLIESDRNFLNKQKKGHNLAIYEKIKSILAKPEIKDISKANPVHLVNSEVSGNIKAFMDREVDPHTRMLTALGTTNPCVTQNDNITSPLMSPMNNDAPLMVLHEAFPALDAAPVEEDIRLRLPSVTEAQNEEIQEVEDNENGEDGEDNEPKERGSATLRQPCRLSNLSELEPSKRNESFITEHLHLTGPTPRLEFINKKDVDSGDCELSYVDEDQLVIGRESSEAQGTFSHFARTATLGTRGRGASKYKPIHKNADQEQHSGTLKSPINKLQKMLSIGIINPIGGGASTRNNTARKYTRTKKNTEFESNELTDDTPLKTVINKNEQFFNFEPQAQQEEIPAAPKIDDAYLRVVDIGNDYHSKWERVSNTPLIAIDKIMPEGCPVVLIRAWAFIEGFTPKEVFDQIFDTQKRAKWETVTMGLSVVEAINENSQVIYFYIKTPIGITERDFVQQRNYMLDYPKQGEITMTFKSVAHEKAPPLKGRIRAETHISGYIMRPSTRAPNSTDFCIISQSDIKGSIPKWIVNTVSTKAPSEWIKKLTQACERSRKEGK